MYLQVRYSVVVKSSKTNLNFPLYNGGKGEKVFVPVRMETHYFIPMGSNGGLKEGDHPHITSLLPYNRHCSHYINKHVLTDYFIFLGWVHALKHETKIFCDENHP